MKEYYKGLNITINGFSERCEILQVKHGVIKFFDSYGFLNRTNIEAYVFAHIERKSRE
jgi:hypothetical protein